MKGRYGLSGKDAKAFMRRFLQCLIENPEKVKRRKRYERRYKNYPPESKTAP